MNDSIRSAVVEPTPATSTAGSNDSPRGDALAPDPTLRRLADPFDRDEAVLDAHT